MGVVVSVEQKDGRVAMSDDGIVCGEYRLLERVGSGGMGTVWRARHPDYERDAAVKVMGAEVAENDQYRDWFRREIWAHARLSHRHVVRLFDLGELGVEAEEATDGELVEGSPFYVMEYSPHGTLREGIVMRGWRPVARVLVQILRGLAFAHARDVIHRDLKPANILCISADPLSVKVADFGLAFAVEQRNHDIRDQNLGPVGTVDYMAPEQIRGEWRRYGAWTDLYAVGCIAFELVCGRRPYPGEDSQAIADAHIDRPVPEVEPLFEIPDDAAAWIRALMAGQPADRFWCAADAARALEDLTRGFTPSEHTGVEVTGSAGLEEETVREDATGNSAETAVSGDTITGPGGRPAMESTEIDPEVIRQSSDGGHEGTPRMPGEPPDFPADWRRDEPVEDETDEPLPLGLFGLMEVPFVDREDERDVLWNTLSDVVERDQIRAVAIAGEEGIGRTRLADWIGRRGHEVGACLRIDVRHSRPGGPEEGLSGMLREIFGTWDLTRDEARRQIERVLQTWYADAFDEGRSERDARVLADRVGRGARWEEGCESTLQFSALPEQFAVIERVLAQIARRRPICLQFDDAHWSRASMEFVRHLLDSDREFGGLVVVTMPPVPQLEESPVGGTVQAFTSHPRTRMLNLAPLTRQSHRALVEGMLGLADDLVEDVVERTGGTPLFAVELVRDWVDRGDLEWTPAGYRLTDDADRRVPDDLHELWERRLTHLTRDLDQSRREEAMRAVELGANFGLKVERNEWRAACEHADIAPIELLFERMIEQGLVMPEPDGWRFAHRMLVESLVRRASDAGRAGRLARACAAVGG
jgi:serine/threonine protein kinase